MSQNELPTEKTSQTAWPSLNDCAMHFRSPGLNPALLRWPESPEWHFGRTLAEQGLPRHPPVRLGFGQKASLIVLWTWTICKGMAEGVVFSWLHFFAPNCWSPVTRRFEDDGQQWVQRLLKKSLHNDWLPFQLSCLKASKAILSGSLCPRKQRVARRAVVRCSVR